MNKFKHLFSVRNLLLMLYSYVLMIGCVEYRTVNEFIVKHAGMQLDTFYVWVSDSYALNMATCAVIIVCAVAVTGRLLMRKYDPLVLMTAVFFIIQLLCNDGWNYATLIGCLGYDMLLLTVALALAIAEIYLLYMKCRRYFSQKELVRQTANRIADISKGGLATDTRNEEIILTGRDGWVKEVAERAIKTDISKDSFAVGIAGGWGSGKTKFLKDIKEELGDSCRILEFNPWNCTSPDQITSDFFSLLSKSLNDSDNEVEKSIKKYVQILTNAEIAPAWIKSIADVLGKGMLNSLESAKSDVQRFVASYPRKVAVLIDDMDRLEKNELFEVLRLIRVSANFSNMIFFVAYDRKYIVDMLEANEVKAAEQYIKKIFQVEISLPDFEGYVLPKLLVRELKGMIGCDDKMMKSLTYAIGMRMKNGVYTLLQYLKNFRDVKRFASSFAISFSACSETKSTLPLVISEFFWIEILKYSDYETYEKLRTTPYLFLETDTAKVDSKRLKILKEDAYNSLSDDSRRIFDMLFSDNRMHVDHNSIVMSYNFSNYFSYRVLEDKVDPSEFYQLLEEDTLGDETLPNAIDKWCREPVRKTKALFDLIMNYNSSDKDESECRSFLKAMFAVARHCSEDNLIIMLTTKLKYSCYNDFAVNAVKTDASDMLKELLMNRVLSEKCVCSLLTKLHATGHMEIVDGEDLYIYKYHSVIPDRVLGELACEDLKRRYLCSPAPPITDVTKEGSALRKYLEAITCIDIYNAEKDFYEDHFVNLSFDALLEYYTGSKSKDFTAFVSPLDLPETSRGSDNEGDDLDGLNLDIRRLFGTVDNYKLFIDKCFDVEQEVKDSYYQRCYIGK